MSLWSRIVNVFRPDRLSREIDEELQSHIADAIEDGRDPDEARRAFGSALRQREHSRELRIIPWLDSLRADAVFGCRQLVKRKITSTAAILSLALAIGACTSAFRLIDAVLLRPMAVTHPERLYAVFRQGISPDGSFRTDDSYEYPLFQEMRAAVKGKAELIAVSWAAQPVDLTYGSDQEMEKASRQYVSGWMFTSFGLKPAAGRLFTESDDVTPRGHPYAVLSYDYWTRRFARDPGVIGRAFHIGTVLYQIVGVAPESFTGTEPGEIPDFFVPAMMHPGVTDRSSGWLRMFAKLETGAAVEPIRAKLQTVFQAVQQDRAKEIKGWPQQRMDNFLKQRILVEPAAAGASRMQRDYRQSLNALGVLVAMVLLIACVNVANLLSAQAGARAREMALRVSIGAGKWRLVQLVMVESALLALFATFIGGWIAWWSAPFVAARINPPEYPARLVLPADWRVLGFAIALAIAVTFLFGLLPALRASSVKPASALKGGDDPHAHRLMPALIAVQVAFCFVVILVGAAFVATFERLTHQSIGFAAQRLLALDTVARPSQPTVSWYQIVEHLRELPGVESAALASWPLMSGSQMRGFVAVNGAPPGDVLAYYLNISPGWFDTMRIPLLDGRDLRPSDAYPVGSGSGVAIVNEAFAKHFFAGENPIGKSFERTNYGNTRLEIVGLVGDSRYSSLREPILPTAYIPLRLRSADEGTGSATFIVRTSSPNPLALASIIRHEIPRVRSEFRVSMVRTQEELVKSQTVRERLLAMLAIFFASVALLLAGIGLYGVLDYSVLQRRREIGIRLAIGARPGDIARGVTMEILAMVLLGAVAGLGLGFVSLRYLETLLYGVKTTDPAMLAIPAITIAIAASAAALPAVVSALRIDPVAMLRAE
jgi:predicted permease